MDDLLEHLRGLETTSIIAKDVADIIAGIIETALTSHPDLKDDAAFVTMVAKQLCVLNILNDPTEKSETIVASLEQQLDAMTGQQDVNASRIATLEVEVERLRAELEADEKGEEAEKNRAAGMIIRQAAVELQNLCIEKAMHWSCLQRKGRRIDGFADFLDFLEDLSDDEREAGIKELQEARVFYNVSNDLDATFEVARLCGDAMTHENLLSMKITEVVTLLENAVNSCPIKFYDVEEKRFAELNMRHASKLTATYLAAREKAPRRR